MRTLAYGTDASLYRLIPKLVVRVESEEEMRCILALAHQHDGRWLACLADRRGRGDRHHRHHRGCRRPRAPVGGGLQAKLKAIAEACVENVVIPDRIACRGWAGDKGFTYPELNASALRDLKAALPDDCQTGYSTSRTCEIGVSLHSGRYYCSIVYLVDRCSEAK